jgi:hypothetical protein
VSGGSKGIGTEVRLFNESLLGAPDRLSAIYNLQDKTNSIIFLLKDSHFNMNHLLYLNDGLYSEKNRKFILDFHQ